MLFESPETRPKHATQPKECVDHGRLGGTPLHNRAFADPGWSLLQGARASIEAAPRVAELMARELRRAGDWQKQTVRNFQQVAQGYLPPA